MAGSRDNLGWHWIFFVNVPIGLVALYIVFRYLPTVHGERMTRNLDYAGAAVFTVGVVFLLLGLTNKATGDWTDFSVGGFLLIAALVTPVFLLIESRAAEPIIPLELFRNRNYSVTILATFLASVGFFGAIIFLPRWLQFVQNVSPTESGLQILPLMAGVIASSVGAGILVSRTGRYKWILTGALLVMGVGILMFTRLDASTEMPMLWLWMFVAGLGIGPTLSVFTIVIQASVPFSRLGVATGNLTFFRQVGGSVGLAVVGTIFADAFASRLAPSLSDAGVPPAQAGMVLGFAADGGGLGQVSDTTLAQQLAQIPPLEGFVDQVVAGVYDAFSSAIADTFWFGLLATFVALVVVALFLRDLPLRHAEAVPVEGPVEGLAGLEPAVRAEP